MSNIDEDIEIEDGVIRCEDCGDTFVSESELDHHIKTVH
jgi:hypothetical protein